MQRKILVHFHIFKNAGSTVDWILEKNFQQKFLLFEHDKKAQRIHALHQVPLHWGDLVSKLENNKDIQAMGSHALRFPLPETKEFEFLPLIMIRHPTDRSFSVISDRKRRPDDMKLISKTKELSTDEYISWAIESKEDSFLSPNPQTSYFSKLNPDNADLKKSIERLKNSFVLGIVDRSDESFVYAEEVLQKFFGRLDFSYIKQNVSPDRAEINELENRLKKEKENVNHKIIEQLEKTIQLDFKLYQFANEELNHRIEEIENFEEKLNDFKLRCQKLQEALPQRERVMYLLDTTHNYDEALQILRKQFEQYPDNPEINYFLGICLHRSKKPEESLAYFDTCLKNGYQEFWVRLNRGLAYLSMGLKDKAMEDFNRAKEIEQDHPALIRILKQISNSSS